jgi:hypothetical protein
MSQHVVTAFDMVHVETASFESSNYHLAVQRRKTRPHPGPSLTRTGSISGLGSMTSLSGIGSSSTCRLSR